MGCGPGVSGQRDGAQLEEFPVAGTRGTVADALRRISERLAGPVAEAGFELVDQKLSGRGPWWLDYRRLDREGPILLSLSQAPDQGLLVAELWQPGHLIEARRLTRAYRGETDQPALVIEFSREVAGWLRDSAPRGSGPDLISFPLLLA